MSEGVIYYNNGCEYLVRLLVSISSLRRFYSGPITLLCEDDDGLSVCELIAEEFDAGLEKWQCPIPDKLDRGIFAKTYYNQGTPYDVTVALDPDTLIIGSIAELFIEARSTEFCIAQFSQKHSSRGRVAKRLQKWHDILPEDIDPALKFGPAINCGVLAFQKNATFYQQWSSLALLGRGTFLPDEVCCQLVLHRFPHKVLSGKWNYSCKLSDPQRAAHIIHYHGNKHCRADLSFSGNLWVNEFAQVWNHNYAKIRDWFLIGDRHLLTFFLSESALGFLPGISQEIRFQIRDKQSAISDKNINKEITEKSPPLSGICIVILNWMRQQNVHEVVKTYSAMNLVVEIIIVNNNPSCVVEIANPKVHILNANKDMGLFTRFAAATLASVSAVLLVDDDVSLPEETITCLYTAWINDPEILHGIFGRQYTPEGYSKIPVFGPCQIVLTRAVLCSAPYCATAIAYAPRFNLELNGTPKGNGEDILLSFVASTNSGRLNVAYALPYNELPSSGESIHRRVPDHYAHRSNVVQWCKTNVKPIREHPNVSLKSHPPREDQIHVSYCTTCHGRLWQLALTLFDNLARLSSDEELILLDYGSPDGLQRFVEASSKCRDAILDGRLVYAQTQATQYNCPKAKNLAHRLGRGRVLVNLDADNSNEGMRILIDKWLKTNPDEAILHMDNTLHNGAFGRIALSRHAYYKLGGYDESFLPSAYQDSDLIERAKRMGLNYILEASNHLAPIKNTMMEKAVYTSHPNWLEMKRLNKLKSDENLLYNRIVANPTGWGSALITVNFTDQVHLEPAIPNTLINSIFFNESA